MRGRRQVLQLPEPPAGKPQPSKGADYVFDAGNLTFRGDFDGGNIGGARRTMDETGDELFEVSIRPDCLG